MYILRPHYGDMSVVFLGSSLKKIKNSLMKEWEYDPSEMEEEEFEMFEKENVKNMDKLLSLKTIDEVVDFYNENFDSDYHIEES